MEKTNLSDLPQVAIEYIDSVIKAMKYRKKVRAEVREELTAHFVDALAECQTDEEKQTTVEELMAEFGDVKMLGRLMRRAKKRCRPLWRTMVARTFQLIGICVLFLIFYIGWFFTGKPVITTNYLEVMNQLVRPVADDNQNAWPFYKQAAQKYVKYENKDEDKKFDFYPTYENIGEDKKFDFHPTNPSPFTRSEQDRQVIQQAIRDNQESLDLIRQGNQKPYYWQVYGDGENEDQEMVSVLLPALGDYKTLAYLLCWQGLLSAEQGDFETSFDDLLEAYSFGQHLRGQNTTLVEQLVAMAVETTSTETLRKVLADYNNRIDSQNLDAVRKQFQTMIINEDFTVDFGSEKLFLYDEAQRCFTRSRFGKSHLYLSRLNTLGFPYIDNEARFIAGQAFHVLFTHPDKEETLKEADRLYSEMEKIAAITPASAKTQKLDINTFVEESMKDNVFLQVLMPALGRVIQLAWRTKADTEATLTILAILQYKKEQGQCPQSLNILVEKRLLKEVPMDPFSDKPLVYRKTGDDFMLYSVGYNFTDDGGMPGEYKGTNKNSSARRWTGTGDAIFWPIDSAIGQQ